MEMQTCISCVLCWFEVFCISSAVGILDCEDFVLAHSPSDPSRLNSGEATSSKGSKTTISVCLL